MYDWSAGMHPSIKLGVLGFIPALNFGVLGFIPALNFGVLGFIPALRSHCWVQSWVSLVFN